MIPVLSPLSSLFVGEYAFYREVLVLSDDPRRAINGLTFIQPETLALLLSRFGSHYSDSDRRALASVWSRDYFLRLIPPVLVADLVLGWHFPIALKDLAIIVGDDGLPQAFKLLNQGSVVSMSPRSSFERFKELLDANLAPFIFSLASYAKLSQVVLWGNVSEYLEGLLSVLVKQPQIPEACLTDAYALLNTEKRPDGLQNPLFQAFCYVKVEREDNTPTLQKQRRVCCLRHRLPGSTFCATCPHRAGHFHSIG